MKRRFDWLSSAAVAAACAALLFLPETRAGAAGSQILQWHVPEAVARLHLQPIGRLDDTNRLKLAIGLPLRDKAGLSNLLQQIYDPNSPNYHHYLSVEQFTESFGPSKADYMAVLKFAMANGLVEIQTHPNRMLVDVDASVADIRRVFHVNILTYNHPLENRQFYAPDTEPSLDLSVPVLHISGLDNYVLPHPLSHKLPKAKGSASPLGGTNNAPLNGSGPGNSFFGSDFRNAYAPGVTLTGTGQNCALFEYDGYFASDITAYETQAGLPNVTLVNVPVDGGITGPPGAGVAEVSLDIEMVIAMAPGISTVFVYESPLGPEDDVLSRMATDNTSKQISSSWVFGSDFTTDQIFQEFAMQGQSFYQASGDSDAYVGPIAPPGDDPYITLVGGTELVMNGSGVSYASESVWNTGYQPPGGAPQFNNYWGSGGGISTTYRIPFWQRGVSMVNNQGSTTFRNLPDVALTADNIWVIAGDETQTGVYQGTSCAAPLWNGFTALINQQAIANGETNQGFINPAIYAIGKGISYSSCFNDIVIGNNTWTNSPTNFYAVPGYDLCTGWGTPNGSNLINALAPISLVPVLSVVTNLVSGGNGNGVIDFDECNNLTIILTNSSGYTATGIQATLFSTTLGAIVAQSTSAYPILLPNASAANLSLFTLSTEPTFICGTPINLVLVVKCDQAIRTNYIQLPSGIVGPPVSFTNATPMLLSSNGVPVSSPVVVSGLQSVGKLTVSVYLAAEYDAFMSLELIGPNGTNVILSQFNGVFGANYGEACSQGLQTTFDDAASVPITFGSAPFVGSFIPQQPLSAFNLMSGTNLNGIWTLQVSDELPTYPAELECWSLNISPEICTDGGGQCPGADLSLTMSASPNPVYENSNLVYTMTVSNAGPGTADNVDVIQTLPAGVGFVTTTGYPVTASQSGSNLNLVLGSLPVYGSATFSVITIPTIPGFITSEATVGSQESDPNPNNNSASASVVVSEPAADLAVTMTGSPAAVLQGGLLTYTINVTNNGPSTANGVTLTTTLPANANFISATASQGALSFNGAFASLGSIGVGSNVLVTIVISPTITGNITASTVVTLSPTEVDPNTFNNSASVSTTVGPAADLSVTAFATPSPVVAGSNLSYVVTVSNAGPSAATGVVFSQSLPAGSAFVTNSLPGSTIVSNNLINITVTNNLASGGSVLFTNVVQSPTLLPGVHSQLMVSTLSVFGQPGDPNINNNVFTVQTVAEPPTVTIVPAGAMVTSGSANGSVGPTGTFGVKLFLQNVGTVPTTNLVGTLQNSNGVTFSSGAQTYGVLVPGAGPTAGQYSFTANSTNGGTIVADLQLQDGANNLGTVTFTFVMPVVQTFWNTNFISIPNQQDIPYPADGPANPYPSSIVVSNVKSGVTTVAVTVSNLLHAYPNDIGMLLVGPTGASCVLMSAVAQEEGMSGPATVTFDQNALVALSDTNGIVSGSYQPADYYVDQYGKTETYSNSPVPVGPYNTNLAVFGSIAANGTWSLYVEDDAEGDWGAISNGWGLIFTTITPVNQLADLAASIVALTNQVVLGQNITNIWTVTNNGPNAVSNVFVTNILSSGLTLLTNVLPAGVINIQASPASIYNLGILVPGGSAVVITNVVATISSGLQTNTISAGSAMLDGNPGNNTASVVTMVNPPPVDLSVAPISVVPNPVVVNNNLVYTLYVTNNGPNNAFNVVGLLANLSNFQVVSANLSQGNYVASAGSVQFNLGTIASGKFAVVTLTVTAVSTGVVTNSWSVSTSANDTNLSNNSSSVQVTVTYPTAVIANGPVTLLSQASPPFNGAINSNQTNTVSFTLLNVGSGATTNLVATLLTNSGVRPITTSNVYGAITAGGSAAQSYTFVASGGSGATVTAELSLKDGSNTNLGPVFFPFMIPMTQSFTNSGVIVIPEVGPASPYPSEIQVSTLTNGLTNLLVSKVTAALNGFAHSWPHDVEAVLVSPTGQELVLMEHTGSFYSVSNLVLTFDDAATQELPLSNTLSSGTFLATEYAPFDLFPGLAAVPASSTNLTFFNGMNPNGSWSLYVYDDTSGNDGVIASGWSLDLTAVSTVNPAARLVISAIESPNPAIGGNYVNYQFTVNNLGPNAATDVVLTDIIPSGTALAPSPVALSQGSYTSGSGTVTCNLGTINSGSSAIVTLKIIAGTSTIINTATVTTASTDLYLSDGISVIKTPVSGNQAPYLSASSTGGGSFQLAIDGYPGQGYAIQVSTNLISWTTLSTNSGSFINVYAITNAPQQFYRAIQLPQ